MRTISRVIVSAILVVLTGLLVAAACYLPGFFDVYTPFSRNVLTFLAGITGPFPFAVWEILLVLLGLWFVWSFVRSLIKKRKLVYWLAGVLEVACILVFLFVGLWGLNHWGPDLSQRLGLQMQPSSVEQLEATTRYMAEQASQWAGRVERDEAGDLAIQWDAMAETAGKSFAAMGETDPFFSGSEARVKYLLVPEAFSYMGITGISVPFTGEACVNPNTYAASIPFTMCHEAAHRMTVSAENDANFAAFLACQASEDPAFQYSGWYSAFVYCYNSLYKADKETARAIRAALPDAVRQDLNRAYEHYAQYDGEVKKVTEKVNDAYLKTFNEESGVQSYGEVTDLLIAWYLQQ